MIWIYIPIMRGNWLYKRGYLPHKNFVSAGTPYSPLFDSPCPGVETREFRGALAPLKINLPLPLIKGKGIKRVPRKIGDFSGCLKGIGLPIKI